MRHKVPSGRLHWYVTASRLPCSPTIFALPPVPHLLYPMRTHDGITKTRMFLCCTFAARRITGRVRATDAGFQRNASLACFFSGAIRTQKEPARCLGTPAPRYAKVDVDALGRYHLQHRFHAKRNAVSALRKDCRMTAHSRYGAVHRRLLTCCNRLVLVANWCVKVPGLSLGR